MAGEIGVGLVGYAFMGKAHSQAWRNVARYFDPPLTPKMVAICGRNKNAVASAAQKFGWHSYETDWRKLVARKDIDLVDVSTPNDSHAPISIAAAKEGKHVFCEKPLARNLEEAEAMLEAVEKAGLKHALCHNYRRIPAVWLAKQFISEGRLGQIYHFRGTYLQDWIVSPDFPLVWRLQKKYAGSGVHGDLAAHVIDLARFLVGEIVEVCGLLHTFIKERPLPDNPKKKGRVDVDDASLSIVKFANGAIGTIEATRFAPGRKNYNRFEINGSKGSIAFNLEQMNELEFYSLEDPPEAQGFRTIMVTEGLGLGGKPVHPFVYAWWPPGHIIGYEHTFTHTVYDLLCAIAEDKLPTPNFYDGVQNQRVLDAIEHSSKEKAWVKVKVHPHFKAGG